jgi:hypothetical protein
MSDPTISCPKCGIEIKLNESLAGPLIEATKREFEGKLAERDAAMDKREAEVRRQQDEVAAAKATIEDQLPNSLMRASKSPTTRPKRPRLCSATIWKQKTKRLKPFKKWRRLASKS